MLAKILNLKNNYHLSKGPEGIKLIKLSALKKYLKLENIIEAPRELIINDHFLRIYYLSLLPKLLTEFRANLYNSKLPLKFNYHFFPVTKEKIVQKAKVKAAVLATLIAEKQLLGQANWELTKEVVEIKVFLDELISGEAEPLELEIYLGLSSLTKPALIKYHQEFLKLTESLNLHFNTAVFSQLTSLAKLLPFGAKPSSNSQLLTTSIASKLLPFTASNFLDSEGMLLGINRTNNSPIIIDLTKQRNFNINIFGISGSGKSILAKLLINRLELIDTKCFIIDSEGEYEKLVIKNKGQVIKFEELATVNPFSLEFTNLAEKINAICEYLEFFIHPSRFDKLKVLRILEETFSTTPSLEQFIINSKFEAFSEDLYQFKDNISKTVPIQFTSGLISFDLAKLTFENQKQATMYLALNIINQLINSLDGQKIIVIDEAHRFLSDPKVSRLYLDLVKTARKRKAGVVSITQNLEDYLGSNAETILTQAETSFILKQNYKSVKKMGSTIFDFSQKELAAIPLFNKGQCLLILDKEHILLEVVTLNSERYLL